MARTVLEGKTAMISGADLATGRAAALQFSRAGLRTVLIGDDGSALGQLVALLVGKGGDSTHGVLPESFEEIGTTLREERDRVGHFHVFVNASGLDETAGTETAMHIHRAAVELARERGFARFILLWPQDVPAPTLPVAGEWVSLVRLPREAEGGAHPLKPGAIADTIVYLAQCPPSACPAEVTLRGMAPVAEAAPSAAPAKR